MRIQAFQRTDGSLKVVAERVPLAFDPRDGAALGSGDVDLARLSPDLVLRMGLEAQGVARDRDARLIRRAIGRASAVVDGPEPA